MLTDELSEILKDAARLKDRGPQSMYAEDEARHMADGVLDLLIRVLEVLNKERSHGDG